MKIQCDVCEKEEAVLFCSADEAALCQACDHRVHHANKLASKHLRFALQSPSSKESPVCDVCQERRALLFCQEDRAILCRECDCTIHRANEYTKKHNRFLMTGVKLSAMASSYQASSTNSSDESNIRSTTTKRTTNNEAVRPISSSSVSRTPESTSNLSVSEVDSHYYYRSQTAPVLSPSSSSISQYLMETLPGWHVEDFLDASSSPYGFYS